jgi:transposase
MAKETTYQTRLIIVELNEKGLSHSEISTKLRLSLSCFKKFWRRFLKEGHLALERQSRSPKRPHPNQTPESVRKLIVETKRKYLKWEAQYIQGELKRRRVKTIPHRRTIERFLNNFPEFPKQGKRKLQSMTDPNRAHRLHQLWQIVSGLKISSRATLRDIPS